MKKGFMVGTVLVAFAAGMAVNAQQSKETPKQKGGAGGAGGNGGGAQGGAGGAGGKANDAPPPNAEMQAWMEMGKPGAEHEKLAKKAGTWKTTTKWFGAPGEPPQTSEGSSVYRMTHGGRYLVEEFAGSAGGMPFTGTGTTGFNNGTRKYEFAWVDSMGTQVMFCTGTIRPDGALEWSGEMWDPMQKKSCKQRGVERAIDADNFVSEMYNVGPDGKEFKSLEIVYKRSK